VLEGNWTYRSYHDDPQLVGGDADKALGLIFGEGVFSFTMVSPARLAGKLDMGGGYVLTLTGKVKPARGASPLSFRIVGLGVANSPTAGWRYDYDGWPAYQWPDGVDQVPSLVGSVVRVKSHGPQSPAGVVASFIAVKQS
jgi:hypothetical protein